MMPKSISATKIGLVTMAPRFDPSGLRRTSSVADVIPWRSDLVTLIWIRSSGEISQAQGITAKRLALEGASEEDCLLKRIYTSLNFGPVGGSQFDTADCQTVAGVQRISR